MKKNKIVILILIFGSLSSLIPLKIENTTHISHNQIYFNERNLSQDNLVVPKTQDLPSSKIQFNSSERINRNQSNTELISSDLLMETPESYDNYESNIDFHVMNGTINTTIVESSDLGGESRSQQAQSFIIIDHVYLLGFSIQIFEKNEIYVNMEIRNQSYSGDSIISFTPFINSGGWINITFSDQIILTPGIYFLWMQEVGSQYSCWEKSLFSENDTETWEFTGFFWQTANYDLTLKIFTSELINPEDVNMKINEVTVIDTYPGQGSVKILGDIISSNINLTVSSDENINFFYSSENFYYKNSLIQHESQFQQEWVEWNLIIDSGFLEYPYFDYKINISGIKDDYYDIQVYNQTEVIGYSLISSEIIGFLTEASHINLKSQNYINDVNLSNNLQYGTNLTINVSTKSIGDIYAFIWNNESLLYQNSIYNVSYKNFQWYINPSLDLNSLTINIFFNGTNQIGYYSEDISIFRVSEIISAPLHVYTLDNFSFSCQYCDHYNQILIPDGFITYEFGDLLGVMEMDIHGNYSDILDLNHYGILPGEYSISLTAEKEYYGLTYSEIPIIISPRVATIELSKSRTTIAPGNTLDFEINLKDIGNQQYLLRPVDLQIKILYSGTNSSSNLVYNERLGGINNKESFLWDIPLDLEEGSYDVVVEVINEYYTGFLYVNQAINIKSSTFWIILIPIFIGLVSSSVVGYYIKKNKVKKSLLGLIILHDNGAPLAEKMSPKLRKSDVALISCAFTGILSLIKEITGSQLRTIEIEGGYVNLIHGKSFWLVIFLKDNPRWIEKDILKLKDEIELKYGKKIENFNGELLEISIEDWIKAYFNTQIITETVNEEELPMENPS
ncbi:hypothetical protein DSAG12_03708 [Promethearchaeum syntrophicum]|uniref:Uncharacterized protein n=1 Tax=Promethearchaeum syntrophicum TaxID=2594042 RepID=A0A5B9DGI6_9ARCH|nr:hypothetical protein [Candidatus Prometheoarchaeum syntrophicum]